MAMYVCCLLGQTILTAGVGVAVILATNNSHQEQPIAMAIGLGIIAYAMAVLFYTLLGVIRLRRADKKENSAKLITEPLAR
jgi:H+/Cl- antiporter ClcA